MKRKLRINATECTSESIFIHLVFGLMMHRRLCIAVRAGNYSIRELVKLFSLSQEKHTQKAKSIKCCESGGDREKEKLECWHHSFRWRIFQSKNHIFITSSLGERLQSQIKTFSYAKSWVRGSLNVFEQRIPINHFLSLKRHFLFRSFFFFFHFSPSYFPKCLFFYFTSGLINTENFCGERIFDTLRRNFLFKVCRIRFAKISWKFVHCCIWSVYVWPIFGYMVHDLYSHIVWC